MIDSREGIEPAETRKARGAFFTPAEMSRYIVEWAIRSPDDTVLEPSCGEAEFLLNAAQRIHDLGGRDRILEGVEVDKPSANAALGRLHSAGFEAKVRVEDFFTITPEARYDAVVGNPPYVRYQDFTGDSRTRARAAALRAGVPLTGLASSWAAFTVHAALFLKPEGRLGLVLPAELLAVNYAAQVRRFLMERFGRVRLVLFTERVFPGVIEEVVLLLAEGMGPTDHCELYQVSELSGLRDTAILGRPWKPLRPEAKWTLSLLPSAALDTYSSVSDETFTTLQTWGETTLGMVTGSNDYFTLSTQQAKDLGIPSRDLLSLSPPGSSHLRGLTFGRQTLKRLEEAGRRVWLFRPEKPSSAAAAYIAAGEEANVNQAYKCRVRSPWWRVPLVKPAHLLVTYMNADTPRLCANRAGVHHLNSVHGLYLRPGMVRLGMDVLPIASLNSMTLLGAETVGRSYGGGILKLEPREADVLPVPKPDVLASARADLVALRRQVSNFLRQGSLMKAVGLIDEVLLVRHLGLKDSQVTALREAHAELSGRRTARGSPRSKNG